MYRMMHFVAAALAGLFGFAAAGWAQSYPTKPVHLIVGYSAGGATDVATRLLANGLSEVLGQQFIVENRPGAGSMLAAEAVARAAPDGYTMYFSNVTIAMPSLFKHLSFEVGKDLVPVSLAGFGQVVLIVHPSMPVKSVKDLVALAKDKPGELNYGSAGTGSFTHLAMALFESLANIKMVHVPYKGSSRAVVGVASGEVQLLFSSPAAALGLIKDGRLRPLAVSSVRRSPTLPDIPTMEEAGVKGYDATSWYGMLAPGKTPSSVIEKVSQASIKALKSPELQKKLLTQGIEPAEGGKEKFAKVLNADIRKWAKVIKDAHIPPQ